jgi:hypothetical protein
MRIITGEGKRNIDDARILRMDRPRTVGEHLLVTLYLITGERLTGIVEQKGPLSDIKPPLAA